MRNFITFLARKHVAVHAYPLAAHLELQHLVAGDPVLAFLEQLPPVFPGMVHQVAVEEVVGGHDRLDVT